MTLKLIFTTNTPQYLKSKEKISGGGRAKRLQKQEAHKK